MQEKIKQLESLLHEVADLNAIAAVLGWDQSTYMPEGGAAARGRQSATLARLSHEKATNPAIGHLLDELEPLVAGMPYDSYEASLVRVTRIQFERAIRIPSDFAGEFAEHTSNSYMVWAEARPSNDFVRVQPYLEKTLEMSRRMADFFPGYQHIADPLIDFSDYGMRADSVRAIFADLREQLVPLVQQVVARSPLDDSCLHEIYPQEDQLLTGREAAELLGYDFKRGRLDLTHHPFCTTFSIGDVRITTRVKPNDFGDCFFSVVHEAGHAMYEQGCDVALEGTPLQGGNSAGVHESQSRLWENVVGRSRGFWEFYYPRLQARFPRQLQNVSLETFYRAINRVAPSLIRVDADELTYNLHVMLRFDLELALLEGSLEVKDLPAAWNARYQQDLGVVSPTDSDGVLQDVHWYFGTIGGMFQGYTLGNIMTGIFYEAALKAHPEISAEIRQGKFGTLHGWLVENIYRHGSKFTTNELIQRATGGEITIAPYMRYLKTKYGELYGLSL